MLCFTLLYVVALCVKMRYVILCIKRLLTDIKPAPNLLCLWLRLGPPLVALPYVMYFRFFMDDVAFAHGGPWTHVVTLAFFVEGVVGTCWILVALLRVTELRRNVVNVFVISLCINDLSTLFFVVCVQTNGRTDRHSGVTMGWLLRLVTGGPTGGRGPPIVLFHFKSEGRGPDLRK